jgi:hypothetical protein
MFAIDIPQKAQEAYPSLLPLIEAEAALPDLFAACRQIAANAGDPAGAFIYAAVNEANRGPTDPTRLERARALLAKAESHPFASFLARYLIEKGQFAPTAVAFESTVPYDVWAATRFYRGYRRNTLRALSEFIRGNAPAADLAVPVICDIGPGNGLLLGDIVAEALGMYRLSKIKVVIIEMSQNMLDATVSHLQSRFGSQVECVSIKGRIQDIRAEDLKSASGGQEFWFTTGSASLHHMPAEMKRDVFRTLAKVSPRLVVTDFVANHDLPEMGSPELIYSVSNFYAYIIDDVWNTTSESAERRWEAIANFFLTEAINMLTKPRLSRIDYHASVELWNDVAAEAGYKSNRTFFTSYDDKRPITFTTSYSQ